MIFEVGDIVRLRSGGPPMTVAEVAEREGLTRVRCRYFAGVEHSVLPFDSRLLVPLRSAVNPQGEEVFAPVPPEPVRQIRMVTGFNGVPIQDNARVKIIRSGVIGRVALYSDGIIRVITEDNVIVQVEHGWELEPVG
jgi:uncharacterized protein YodC (DUF2158 family)